MQISNCRAGGYSMLLNSTLLRAPAAALIARLLSQGLKDISESPTLCPGLTYSKKEEITQQRSLEPTAASGTQDSCWLGAGLLG